ncbi:bZIP transcription factor bZIP-1 [Penicillium chermesinum]|uniref:BZIP transcription factor bZIP-1 n=1 Tax=Penicillium chermesinum TaxID=63820 RepID=A0A9W9TX95_9EURO|nr:bZIP transcription factor bZIP-1 [Penicillium chermesinum]KAJ5246368.1 bZIP transcription factor bZIP-1 [Penicillium chermesinum]
MPRRSWLGSTVPISTSSTIRVTAWHPPPFSSLSDSGSYELPAIPPSAVASSANSQDGRSYSNASPASQIPTSVSNSPATSQGDDVLSRVDASRVEKRRLNTLAARRCRQRRVDRLKSVEDELELVRKERDELRLRVSKLEGETEALRGLLSRGRN